MMNSYDCARGFRRNRAASESVVVEPATKMFGVRCSDSTKTIVGASCLDDTNTTNSPSDGELARNAVAAPEIREPAERPDAAVEGRVAVDAMTVRVESVSAR